MSAAVKKTISKPRSTPSKINQNQYNWVQSLTYPIRDVLIAALEKGQFIIAGLILVVGIFIFRLPANELTSFSKSLLDRLLANHVWGWAFFIFAIIGWYLHAKYINKINQKEVDRVTQEKNILQEKIFSKLNKN